MDLSTVSDLSQLKSMAYDEIAKKELAERNLALINARIQEVAGGSLPANTPPAPSENGDVAPNTPSAPSENPPGELPPASDEAPSETPPKV